MGFDFIVIVPFLPSHCGFSFVFGCGVSFLVSSSVFLSMIVQQLVVILVLSHEGVRACPSPPPSRTNQSGCQQLLRPSLELLLATSQPGGLRKGLLSWGSSLLVAREACEGQGTAIPAIEV